MELNSYIQTAEAWPTRFRFSQPCGCRMNIGAETVGDALAELTADYTAHAGHSCQEPVIAGMLLKRPGIQIGIVILNYTLRPTELIPGGPLSPEATAGTTPAPAAGGSSTPCCRKVIPTHRATATAITLTCWSTGIAPNRGATRSSPIFCPRCNMTGPCPPP